MKPYTKPATTLEEQLDLLVSRGLVVEDRPSAIHWLSQVSYYRLRGYTFPFQNNAEVGHPFWKPTELTWLRELYEFDRNLRLVVMDGIERVEVAVRTQVVLNLSLAQGPWWFEDSSLFARPELHVRDLGELDKELQRSHEVFLDHYKKEYSSPARPPAWMTLEVASFGLLSKIFQNLRIGLHAKKQVLAYFGLGEGGARFLESWLHHLSTIRNLCAHHSRLWNRISKQPVSFAPRLAAPWLPGFPDPQRLYATLALLAWLNHKITDNWEWREKLKALISDEPSRYRLKSMGFPPDWEKLPLWNSTI